MAEENPIGATTKDRWPVSLKLIRRALNNALVEHGARIRPFGFDGPEVMAANEVHVRAEFVAAYPADGETEAKRVEAKRKAFKRGLKSAIDKGLIASRDVGGEDKLWLVVCD